MSKIINKNEILFIAAETDYVKHGLEKDGYTVFHPYRYKTIIGRILLEIFSRLNLPQTFLFNKKITKVTAKYIIILDSIVTKKFLLWVQKNFPDSKIIFKYTNMVGKARHLLPSQIPQGIDIWTYDKHDSEAYNIKLNKCGGYCTSLIGEKREKIYDVVYVGRDKGRASYIMKLKKKFESMGLVVKFLIIPTTRISRKKSYYSRPIPYKEVIKLITESRAILNVLLPDQQGATLRDYESIYNEVKLITTNTKIKNLDFYDKENIFILNEDNLNDLKSFLYSPYKKLSEELLKQYSINTAVAEMIGLT